MPEYEYWREREAALSSIVEQLKKPMVVRVSDLLELAKSPIIDGFIHYLVDLKRYYIQARDNVKFLSTILRHFKVKIKRKINYVIIQRFLDSYFL